VLHQLLCHLFCSERQETRVEMDTCAEILHLVKHLLYFVLHEDLAQQCYSDRGQSDYACLFSLLGRLR
jgi:hypothetical protein